MTEKEETTPKNDCKSIEDLSMNGGGYYEITVNGQIDAHWAEWFGGLSISYDCGFTTLAGVIRDQSALHGVLAQIRDLNLILVSVTSQEADQ